MAQSSDELRLELGAWLSRGRSWPFRLLVWAWLLLVHVVIYPIAVCIAVWRVGKRFL